MATATKQRVFNGVGVSPGVAIGAAAPIAADRVAVPDQKVAHTEVGAEIERLEKAVRKSRRQILALKRIRDRLPDAAAAELGEILETHVHMLGDSRLVRGARQRIENDRMNAAAAVKAESDTIVAGFLATDDRYLSARADDVREVSDRLLRNLTEKPKNAFAAAAEGSVLLAEAINPADTVMMDPDRIAGFAAIQGGAQGHTAILARSVSCCP